MLARLGETSSDLLVVRYVSLQPPPRLPLLCFFNISMLKLFDNLHCRAAACLHCRHDTATLLQLLQLSFFVLASSSRCGSSPYCHHRRVQRQSFVFRRSVDRALMLSLDLQARIYRYGGLSPVSSRASASLLLDPDPSCYELPYHDCQQLVRLLLIASNYLCD